MTTPLTEDFIEEVDASLGGSLVSVELDERDYWVCFKKAKRTFFQKGHYGYRRDFYTLGVERGQQLFGDIPEDVEDIVRIIKPSYGSSFTGVTEDPVTQAAYSQVFFGGGGGGCQRPDYLTYELAMQLSNFRDRYNLTEIQFNFDPFRKEVYALHPANRDETWMLETYRRLEDEELQGIDWVIRWTIAEAKIMLGMAYRKFQSLPSPTGETSLDGNSLVQEGNQDKEQLLRDIENYTDGAIDTMEISIG